MQVVSSVLAGAAVGSLSGGNFADTFGRRKTLGFDTVIMVIGALLCASAKNLTSMVIGRFVVGIAIGISSAIVPLYISEVRLKTWSRNDKNIGLADVDSWSFGKYESIVDLFWYSGSLVYQRSSSRHGLENDVCIFDPSGDRFSCRNDDQSRKPSLVIGERTKDQRRESYETIMEQNRYFDSSWRRSRHLF